MRAWLPRFGALMARLGEYEDPGPGTECRRTGDGTAAPLPGGLVGGILSLLRWRRMLSLGQTSPLASLAAAYLGPCVS